MDRVLRRVQAQQTQHQHRCVLDSGGIEIIQPFEMPTGKVRICRFFYIRLSGDHVYLSEFHRSPLIAGDSRPPKRPVVTEGIPSVTSHLR